MINKTPYSRRLDTTGRLVVPAKLRSHMGMVIGDEYTFYIMREGDDAYLAIKVPYVGKDSDLGDAVRLLEDNGYFVEKLD